MLAVCCLAMEVLEKHWKYVIFYVCIFPGEGGGENWRKINCSFCIVYPSYAKL